MKHKVLIMRCDEYAADRIHGIIREGMQELDVRPAGNILLKPNAVIAHPEIFPHAYTRSEFLDGAIAATKDRATDGAEIAVGERSGITVPTRFNFKNAGYLKVIRRHRIKTHYFDETGQVPVALKDPRSLRRQLFVPKPVRDCDFLVNLPKFKAHPWCRLTLSLKNLIGIQDDRHRLVDHNLFLEHKIVDLQEIVPPGFIAVDAIIAGQKMMLTPTPFRMGAIVLGINSCAVDTVCCHMVHTAPQDLVHLRYAAERGFGPIDLNEIEITGDFPLEAVREKTRGFAFCLERIDETFDRSATLRCTVGSFPEKHSSDYCRGGCPGALQEAMHIINGIYPGIESRMKKIHYVVGRVLEDLDLGADERILFAGACTEWKGAIDGESVNIVGRYRRPSETDETKTPSNDMLLKTWQALKTCFVKRRARYLHAAACPVSVAEHVHYLSAMGRIPNVNFDPRLLLPVNLAYWKMRFFRLLNRLLGR